MRLVGVNPHIPEGVRHIGLTHEYPFYWERLSQCHEFVKNLGQRVCVQALGDSARVSISVEPTFLPSTLLIKRSFFYDPDLVGDYGRQRRHS